MVLRSTAMQGDALPCILLQPLTKKEDKNFHVFHCSSNHINLAAQRYMKLSGSFPGCLADPQELFCCRMHLTAEGGAAETGSAEASGCMIKTVQQWSYKMVIPYSCWAQQLSGKRKEKPSADCSIWQLEPILLQTLPSPGAHVPSLRHYHWDAWIPPHSFSHDKSLFVSVWQN